jgi:hypothetical protein
MTYDNRNKGTIAKNARKESDTHPDIAGQINVDGTDYWISGWLKTNSQDGSKFYSLSVKPKEARQEAPAPPARQYPADKASRRVQSVDATGDGFTYPGNGNPDDIPF